MAQGVQLPLPHLPASQRPGPPLPRPQPWSTPVPSLALLNRDRLRASCSSEQPGTPPVLPPPVRSLALLRVHPYASCSSEQPVPLCPHWFHLLPQPPLLSPVPSARTEKRAGPSIDWQRTACCHCRRRPSRFCASCSSGERVELQPCSLHLGSPPPHHFAGARSTQIICVRFEGIVGGLAAAAVALPAHQPQPH